MKKFIYNKSFTGEIVDTAPRAVAPTITPIDPQLFFNKVTFTVTNNEASTATIFYGLEARPRTNFVVLGANEESDELELGGNLPSETTFSVNAVAQTSGKLTSIVTSESITTKEQPIYINATGGTTLEYNQSGKRYRSHTFTSSGNFEVLQEGNSTSTGDRRVADYLIIAGGGGGSAGSTFSRTGGGGGAGGFRTTIEPVPSNETPDAKIILEQKSYEVIVGAGGSGKGTNSSVDFEPMIISEGGGAGGGNGGSGGSGGGASGTSGGVAIPTGGVGTLGQGRDGGGRSCNTGSPGCRGGGGGGAGNVGGGGAGNSEGAGGVGLANSLRTGSNETRASGGRGGSNNVATNQPANTGNGGMGGRSSTSDGDPTPTPGASGIVIIRYEIAPN